MALYKTILMSLVLFIPASTTKGQNMGNTQDWNVCLRKKCIPKSVINELTAHADFRINFRIANPGKYFRTTDISIGRDDIPRGLVLTATRNELYILSYHHAIFQLHSHLILLKKNGSKYTIIKSLYIHNNINTLDSILVELEKSPPVLANEY